MGLKIEHMDETTLKGTLDGMIPVRGTIEGDTVRITIAGFLHELSCDLLSGACQGSFQLNTPTPMVVAAGSSASLFS